MCSTSQIRKNWGRGRRQDTNRYTSECIYEMWIAVKWRGTYNPFKILISSQYFNGEHEDSEPQHLITIEAMGINNIETTAVVIFQ